MVVLVPTPPDLRRGQSCWRRTGLQERRSGAPKRSEGGLNSSGLPHLEKSPLLPATILFRWVNGEISGIPRTRTSSQLRSLGLILFSHHQSKEPTKRKKDMKRLFSPLSILGAVAFLAVAAGCTTPGQGPLSTAGAQTEGFLISAGFKTKTPSTPKQQEHFKTLTPNKIMTRHRNGKTYYVYADAAQNQLYIGNQAQYQKYQQIRKANNLVEDQIYSEAMGDWGAWEPWGS